MALSVTETTARPSPESLRQVRQLEARAGRLVTERMGPDPKSKLSRKGPDRPEGRSVRSARGRRWVIHRLMACLVALAALLGAQVMVSPVAAHEETRLSHSLAASQTAELPPPQGDELLDPNPPLEASAAAPTWIWGALLMAGFVGLSVVTVALARLPVLQRPAPLTEPREEKPEVIARRALDAIAQGGLPTAGEMKEYYRRIAGCLREYLARRFDVPAAPMTPKELESRLEDLGVECATARLAVNLLEQCDAAQFGEFAPAPERAEAALASAYEIIALTTPDAKPSGPRDEPPNRT